MADRIPIVVGAGLYAMIFLSALVAGVIGLVAGPRHWTQRLCKWNLWTTGIFLTLLAGILICFVLAGACRAELAIAPVLLFAFLLCSPLLIAFFGLLTVWLCRVSPSGA